MRKVGNPTIALTITLMLLFSLLSPAFADNLNGGDSHLKAGQMTADALIVRPVSFVSTVLGFGLFIISAPFALLGGNAGEVWDTLVANPAKFTFKRPLGQFD
jgi:hypothetical protein